MNADYQLDNHEEWSTEGYWASYSDLMAGILLVFAIAAAASWVQLQRNLVRPTEQLQEWQTYLDSVCHDEEFANEEAIQVVCETGSLIIAESSLRFELNRAELAPEGKALLERVVPMYLDVVQKHREGSASIQLAGVEISGHTDSTGTIHINTALSSSRAGNVLLFLLESEVLERHHPLLKTRGYSVGHADSKPPLGEAKRADEWPDARRIEIQVHIDNASILRDIKQILEGLRGEPRSGQL